MDGYIVAAFVLLALMTAAVAVGILGIWHTTRAPHFVLGLLFAYYFSLAGGWKLVYMKMNGTGSDSLDHLEASLFPISVDDNYLLTILIYGLFLLALIVALQIVVQHEGPRPASPEIRVSLGRLNHVGLIVTAALSLLLSMLLIWSAMVSAFESGVSAYSTSRSDVGQFFTVHQILNRIGLDAIAIGLGAASASRQTVRVRLMYLMLACAWVAFLGLLGNRNELLVALIGGAVWYWSVGGRARFSRVAMLAVVGFFVMRLIELTRGWAGDSIAGGLGDLLASGEFWNPLALATGSESLAAHMSLYGILSQHIQFTHGASLLYMVNSLVPRFVASERVEDSYAIYASAVSAPVNQGFTIHFAAGWYLNYGLIAVVAGAALLAVIWGGLFRRVRRQVSADGTANKSLLAAFCFCSAYIPTVMRDGPEGLKSLVLEAIVIPYLLALFASAPEETRADSNS